MQNRYLSRLFGPVLLLLSSVALAGQPNFMPALWGDGQLWGTKGTTSLPAATADTLQSFDPLYIIINNPDNVQLPVAEAAPGNPAYNGGRWFVHSVLWTAEGLAAYSPVPVITSYEEILFYEGLGHLVVAPGTFDGGPPTTYFQCPLLPVKAF